jgi:hypothetical protein
MHCMHGAGAALTCTMGHSRVQRAHWRLTGWSSKAHKACEREGLLLPTYLAALGRTRGLQLAAPFESTVEQKQDSA